VTRGPQAQDGPVRVMLTTASVRCAPLLDGPPRPVDVLGVMPAAIYLATRDRRAEVVAVLARDAVRHPAALVLSVPSTEQPFRSVAATEAATIGEGRLVLPMSGPMLGGPASLELRVGRWYEPVPGLPRPDPHGIVRASVLLDALLDGLVDANPPRDPDRGVARDLAVAGLARLERALRAADAAGTVAAADALLGAGPGLTPSGDDMLAGLLATLVHLSDVAGSHGTVAPLRTHVLGAAPERTTLLSASLLRHAADGAVAEPFGRLLHAIVEVGGAGRDADGIALRSAVDEVGAIGATSGLDLLAGCAVALRIAAASVVTACDALPGTPHQRVLHAHEEGA